MYASNTCRICQKLQRCNSWQTTLPYQCLRYTARSNERVGNIPSWKLYMVKCLPITGVRAQRHPKRESLVIRRALIAEMRSIRNSTGFAAANINGGPLMGPRLPASMCGENWGPFRTVEDCHLSLRQGLEKGYTNWPETGEFIETLCIEDSQRSLTSRTVI